MRLHFFFPALFLLAAPIPARAEPLDPSELAARVDRHLAATWAKAETVPAAPADDGVFVRRVYLDLMGRIPTVAEAREFLEDKSPNKRAKLAKALVATGGHARHAATTWRRVWVPQADTPRFAPLVGTFEEWFASRLIAGRPYDDMVREVLLSTPPNPRARGGIFDSPGVQAFATANEAAPENLAANTARAFLGINLDCAQCHNHPFSRWTRDQFWQTATFFARPTSGADAKAVRLELAIPASKKVVGPKFLDDSEPTFPGALEPVTGPRLLAEWVTARENPYFARNAVNRVWADLFGTGLVEPLDDLSEENPSSHPELLGELAAAFRDSGFDLRYLSNALVLTRAYQLSSRVPDNGTATVDPRLFARMPVRGLSGEQLYDSLRVAAGLPAERADLDPIGALRDRERFATRFHNARPANAQRSIVQALSLLNGRVTSTLTDPEQSPSLRAVVDAPFLDTRDKVESLFLAALGRRPSEAESRLMSAHVESGGAKKSRRKALADLFWALINCSEFNTNH